MSTTGWFSESAFTLLWTERYGQLRPLLDASISQARATGDGIRLAMSLAVRSWLALRRGDLCSAEGDARTAIAATELPAPPMFRVLNGAVLLEALVERGELDAAEQALAPLDSETESGSLISPPLRFARGRLRIAQGRIAEGLEDLQAVGALLTRSLVTCAGCPSLAIGSRIRPPRPRRPRIGGTPDGRGASAGAVIRCPARTRRGVARGRRRRRWRPRSVAPP